MEDKTCVCYVSYYISVWEPKMSLFSFPNNTKRLFDKTILRIKLVHVDKHLNLININLIYFLNKNIHAKDILYYWWENMSFICWYGLPDKLFIIINNDHIRYHEIFFVIFESVGAWWILHVLLLIFLSFIIASNIFKQHHQNTHNKEIVSQKTHSLSCNPQEALVFRAPITPTHFDHVNCLFRNVMWLS